MFRYSNFNCQAWTALWAHRGEGLQYVVKYWSPFPFPVIYQAGANFREYLHWNISISELNLNESISSSSLLFVPSTFLGFIPMPSPLDPVITSSDSLSNSNQEPNDEEDQTTPKASPTLPPPKLALPLGKSDNKSMPPPSFIRPRLNNTTSSSLAPSVSTLPPQNRPRQKVVLEPGHSPLDWARLKSSGTDLRVHTRTKWTDAGNWHVWFITYSAVRVKETSTTEWCMDGD